MSWTVACFCGTVFESPMDRCPTCHTPVPKVVSAADGAESVRPPETRVRTNGQPVARSRVPASRWNVARSTSNAANSVRSRGAYDSRPNSSSGWCSS